MRIVVLCNPKRTLYTFIYQQLLCLRCDFAAANEITMQAICVFGLWLEERRIKQKTKIKSVQVSSMNSIRKFHRNI